MIAVLDVDYRGDTGVAACVVAQEWVSAVPLETQICTTHPVAPYESGQFYRRELPCLQNVLGSVTRPIDLLIVDGYTQFHGGQAGLGAHLYEALLRRIPVVGVAKTKNLKADPFLEVCRGGSLSPLYVSAIGMDLSEAADAVRQMHGPHRIPTLLKLVDTLCRKTPLVSTSAPV